MLNVVCTCRSRVHWIWRFSDQAPTYTLTRETYDLFLFQRHADIFRPKRVALILFITYLLSIAVSVIPPFVGLGLWTENVKFKICLWSAYDLYSYVYVSVFLNGLTVTPASLICLVALIKIFLQVCVDLHIVNALPPKEKINLNGKDSGTLDQFGRAARAACSNVSWNRLSVVYMW